MTLEDHDQELANPRYPRAFGKWYDEHKLFSRLDEIRRFYNSINYTAFGFVDGLCTGQLGNFHSYIYAGIEGTIESMQLLFQNGRINDGFTLMRKYSDAIVIDTYAAIVLKDIDADGDLKAWWDKINDNIVKKWIASQSTILARNPGKELQKILNTFPKVSEILKLDPKSPNSLYDRIREISVYYTHLRAHQTSLPIVCSLLV
ncbi:MAG: hypothetical protein K2I68_07010, partial [Bacteroidales bacterium]|nr:hypothetical protein [Bacteroidales bacterium]